MNPTPCGRLSHATAIALIATTSGRQSELPFGPGGPCCLCTICGRRIGKDASSGREHIYRSAAAAPFPAIGQADAAADLIYLFCQKRT